LPEKSYRTIPILIILGLIIFGLVDWFLIIPIFWDLGVNLLANAIFAGFTIFCLDWLIKFRERLRKKSLEEKVRERVGEMLYYFFNVLKKFVTSRPKPPFRLSREEFFNELEELNSKKKLDLSPYFFEYFFPRPTDKLSLWEFDGLLESYKHLSDFEMKYFEFMEPELHLSLMEIQRRLRSIIEDFNLMKMFEVEVEEVVSKSMSESIQSIIKEIYKIHKMGIKIYFPS